MSNIHYIKNITAFKSFGTRSVDPTTFDVIFEGEMGVFSINLNSMPDFTPDEVIVRGISFNTYNQDIDMKDEDKVDNNVYLIRSNIDNNNVIASLVGGVNTSIFPQTVVKMLAPVPNILEFQIHTPQGMNESRIVDNFKGDLAIHLDFIKYKRTQFLNHNYS